MKHLRHVPLARLRRDAPSARLRRALTLTIAVLTLFPAGFAAGDSSQQGAGDAQLTAKGIYHDVDRYQRSGLKFRILLDENGKERPVSTSYPFRTGDRFSFSFEINRDTYIYVINRTQTTTTASVAAGYQSKRVSSRTRFSEPRLLFPTSRAGNDNRLASSKAHAVPGRGYFVMDAESGVERLYVVVSDRRLDFSNFFHTDTGEHRGSATYGTAALQARLDGWKGNAVVELVPKGIRHEVDGYGATVDATQPAVVEIDLKHYR